MRATRFCHWNDHDVLCRLDQVVAQESINTAEMVELIVEVDERCLYLPAGYPTMRDYCVVKLGLSEDAAYQRIQAARAAQRFPSLLEAAAHRSKAEIQLMLARRFPRSESLALVRTVTGGPTPPTEPSVVQSESDGAGRGGESAISLAPGQVKSAVATTMVEPIAPERFELHATFSQTAHDKLEYARDLMSHRVAARDPVTVIELGLDALIEKLEKQRFAAAANPRPGRGSRDVRYIPAHVKRAVWKRDRGRCTFVGDSGHCCGSRRFVQFDHQVPRARGGPSTVENVRLLCGPHNRLEAERIFGAGFMSEKRERSRSPRAVRPRVGVNGNPGIEERTGTDKVFSPKRKPRGVPMDQVDDVLGCLRNMRFPEEEARRAVECCDPLPDALPHECLAAALVFLGAHPDFYGRYTSGSAGPS